MKKRRNASEIARMKDNIHAKHYHVAILRGGNTLQNYIKEKKEYMKKLSIEYMAIDEALERLDELKKDKKIEAFH